MVKLSRKALLNELEYEVQANVKLREMYGALQKDIKDENAYLLQQRQNYQELVNKYDQLVFKHDNLVRHVSNLFNDFRPLITAKTMDYSSLRDDI